MLSLQNNIEKGMRIYLREKWHANLLAVSQKQNYPYEYRLVDIVKKDKETYYICESANKKYKIAFTEFAIKYLMAKEVPDSNLGFSFKEYLPVEDTYILMTNVKKTDDIVPAIFKMQVKCDEINNEKYNVFMFVAENIRGKATDIRHYAEGCKKSTWKFVFHDDLSYMNDYEMQYQDTIMHKVYVKKSAEKLAKYLENKGAIFHAEELRKRAIELHWKHNSHHPEHFKSSEDMKKIDILEMCCDWHARSTQYKTNFLEYIQTQQKKRFHFPDWMFAEIMHYCQVLASDI